MNSSVIRATWPRQSVVPLPYSLSPWTRGVGEGEGRRRRRRRRGQVCLCAKIGNHFLPLMVDYDMPILVWFQNWHKMHSLFYRVTCAISANFGLIPKLAQDAFSILQSDSCAISANVILASFPGSPMLEHEHGLWVWGLGNEPATFMQADMAMLPKTCPA